MPQTVLIPTVLRKHTGEKDTVRVAGNTVTQILDEIEKQHPGFRSRVCEEGNKLRRFVNIYVNGEDIRFLNNLSTSVSDGAEVSIVLAVAGG